ncbi:hypothetical protein DL93DRAFT_2090986 [Clavulina sp. PMI_390]|nr:hypothetical protein DL93DRAFT_2090986 [Clavulina sp. PMI_390]
MSSATAPENDKIDENTPKEPAALIEGPTPSTDAPKLDVNSGDAIKFDSLGPLVVNSDGTLSRIANWHEMTERERATTVRLLVKRNKIRLEDQERKIQQETE